MRGYKSATAMRWYKKVRLNPELSSVYILEEVENFRIEIPPTSGLLGKRNYSRNRWTCPSENKDARSCESPWRLTRQVAFDTAPSPTWGGYPVLYKHYAPIVSLGRTALVCGQRNVQIWLRDILWRIASVGKRRNFTSIQTNQDDTQIKPQIRDEKKKRQIFIIYYII